MTGRVLGLGAAAMDVVLECEDLPREDGFSFVHRERLMPGGSCANVLVAASRLGARAALAAQMGDDDYGRAFIEDLERCGVSTDHVRIRKGGISLHTFITVTPNGAKSIFVHNGDSLLRLRAEEVEPGWLDGMDVFYTDMFPAPPALKLARVCRDRGVHVVFNLEAGMGFMGLCGADPGMIREMIGLSDLFITSGHPLRELTGEERPETGAARVLDELHPRHGVVITLGERGAIWTDANDTIHQPAHPVRSVDTTGAGDVLTAGLICAFFLEYRARDQALAFASAAAAIKCTQPGPRLNATARDVRDLMRGATP